MDKQVGTVILCLCLSLSLAAPDFLLKYGEDTEKHWAVIVAGSNGWYNYRHQADACHAYQVLISHGFHPDRIITMMFDDLAQSMENPTPGIVINRPDGPDVYKGVKIDYKGDDVTPDIFLAILKGDTDAVQGKGTGRVLQSGANDHVFVNFVDHGAPGILGFPSEYLKSTQLINAINFMNKNNMYKQMVMYIEACESGSMFDGILPSNVNVYATTAANPKESSYACYMDEKRQTYLGDVYSVKWMEDSDKEDLKTETLHKQFKLVREETNTSHVMQYGDTSIATEDVAEFQGGQDFVTPTPVTYKPVPFDAVPSEDVPLHILYHKLRVAKSPAEQQRIMNHLDWMKQVRSRVDSLMKDIVLTATARTNNAEDMYADHQPLRNHPCYEAATEAFHNKCVKITQNDYAMRRLYLLVNLCEEGILTETVVTSILKVCADNVYN